MLRQRVGDTSALSVFAGKAGDILALPVSCQRLSPSRHRGEYFAQHERLAGQFYDFGKLFLTESLTSPTITLVSPQILVKGTSIGALRWILITRRLIQVGNRDVTGMDTVGCFVDLLKIGPDLQPGMTETLKDTTSLPNTSTSIRQPDCVQILSLY